MYKKTHVVFLYVKYTKFWSISLEHFVDRKPLIYEEWNILLFSYSGKKKFLFGRQPETMNIGETRIFVMPSSSARVAQLPRAADKVPFFEALRKFRDYLNGKIDKIEECEVTFASVVLKNWPKANSIKVEKPEEPEEECVDNNMINGDPMCLDANISPINTNV